MSTASTHSVPRTSIATPATRAGKYLTFFLSDEEYGLEILKVSEIIGMQPITRVPRTPEFIRGVINLRGKVIPIADLRIKLGMNASSADENCIIVVQLRDVQTGLVVDRVSEVVVLAESDIADAPDFANGAKTELLLGIGMASGRVTLLLDIDKVLAVDDAEQPAESTNVRAA